METKFNFTDKKLKDLVHDGSKKRIILFDANQPGLALQLTQSGTKTFQLRLWDRHTKKTIIKSLGKYGSMSILAARIEVNKLACKVNDKVDIVAEANSIGDEDTLQTMFDRFIQEHSKPHKITWKEDVSRYRLYLEKPLGAKRVSWFTPDRVRRWHREVTEQPLQRGVGFVSATTANHVLKLLTVIFNKMRPEGPNPCVLVKKYREVSRDRFLKPDEIGRFFTALHDTSTNQDFRDYILLSLNTGARRNNVMAMRWSDLDLTSAIWVIRASESKNAASMTIPLTTEALEILQRRKAETSSMFVLASSLSKTGHLVEPKRAWQVLLRRAGLNDVKIHDLRRTLGSYMAIAGSNTVAVGKALGHKSPQSTVIYARMHIDPVRLGMQGAIDLMKKTAAETSPKIVQFKVGNE